MTALKVQQDLHHSLIGKAMAEILGISDSDFTIEQNTVATNNHVYIISLSKPTESERTPQNAKPFTVAVPAGTSRLVIRIAKADNNVEDSVRIRNEVACLTLARKALAHVDPLLVARVFGWDDDASDGYILQEFKPGELLSHADLRALGEQDLRSVCAQLAAVAKAWQDYRLPVEGYGGLTFDDDGRLSTTEIVFRTGGPFSTYTEYVKATLEWQLAESENVAALNGWRDTPGLRERIDAFVANGLDRVLSKVPEYKPTLVHGDLSAFLSSFFLCAPPFEKVTDNSKLYRIFSSTDRQTVSSPSSTLTLATSAAQSPSFYTRFPSSKASSWASRSPRTVCATWCSTALPMAPAPPWMRGLGLEKRGMTPWRRKASYDPAPSRAPTTFRTCGGLRRSCCSSTGCCRASTRASQRSKCRDGWPSRGSVLKSTWSIGVISSQ